MGSVNDLVDAVKIGGAQAVAIGHMLHYKKLSLSEIRQGAAAAGVRVRRP